MGTIFFIACFIGGIISLVYWQLWRNSASEDFAYLPPIQRKEVIKKLGEQSKKTPKAGKISAKEAKRAAKTVTKAKKIPRKKK